MQSGTTYELPFTETPELELHAEFGNLEIRAVEPGQKPRLELGRGWIDSADVHIEKHGNTVRVALEPRHGFGWFGAGWDARAELFVPRNVRAHVQANAGRVAVRDLYDCELGIKTNAGKIDLAHVHGLLHVGADAGSVSGEDVGGFIDAEAQAGSIRLDITSLQPGEHRIHAAMGTVRLQLARGLDVSIQTSSSLGSARNSYPSNHSAAAKLTVSTDMGSVRIDEGRFGPSGYVYRPAPAAATPPKPPAADASDPELERVLQMVEKGEISAQEADELLQAMGRV